MVELQAENEKLKLAVMTASAEPPPVDPTLPIDPPLPENVANIVRALLGQLESEEQTSTGLMKSFCISSANHDQPILYASPGFTQLTGYDMHSILGHNCRFLQGPDTDANEVITFLFDYFIKFNVAINYPKYVCPLFMYA